MGVTFRRRITWPKNDLLLPAELYNVNVPAGLSSMDVRVPNIVDTNRMMQLAPGSNSSSSGSLSLTEGLVKSDVSVSFPNPAAQCAEARFLAQKTPIAGRASSSSPAGR